MNMQIEKNLIKAKQAFSNIYDGNSQIQEIIPTYKSESFPIDEKHLELLHKFARNNPIYYNSYEIEISDISYVVYEGDINEYWLSSISHDTSHAPFSPTWIISAYALSLQAKNFGYNEIIDVGSGDGRIAYCAKILDLTSYGIEIDDELVELQKSIISSTGLNFNPNCTDITKFDFSTLKLSRPAFCIGGLAQMGGDVLATAIIKKINSDLKKNTTMILAGTYSKKYPGSELNGGWDSVIRLNNLKIIKTISLPTVWTFNEPDETPYIFTEFN